MWNYEKRLQYPVKITKTNPKLAQVIISQFGGPDGELAASMRYLSQRYTMPYKEVTGILTGPLRLYIIKRCFYYINGVKEDDTISHPGADAPGCCHYAFLSLPCFARLHSLLF